MLFEPVLHDMFAEEIRSAFPDWNAADFLIQHICSQNEFEACFRRLEQSARTWHTGPTSMNYLANIEPLL